MRTFRVGFHTQRGLFQPHGSHEVTSSTCYAVIANRAPERGVSDRRPVFIVGSPRSGTTWLQLLLAQHPAVATCQETHLFERYLAHLDRVWVREAELAQERDIGLGPLMSQTEFHGLCRSFATAVFDRIEPGAEKSIVVEKTPGHVLSAPFIASVFPEAHFVHVIRDPRAVASSLVRAGKGWGSRWAPRGVATATAVWTEHVEAGLRIPDLTEAYTELRYEDLLAAGPDRLEDLARKLDLDVEPGWAEHAVEACSIDGLRTGESEARIPWKRAEPEGFFGRGRAEGWRDDLSSGQVRTIEYMAGALMARLGYERATTGDSKPFAVRKREVLERARASLDWRIGRASAGQ